MNQQTNTKGISLIVLVITIIVMIILAGAIIISLTNGNVINKAKQAVNETNDANIREQIGVAMLSHSFEETETLKECLQKISGATIEDTNNPDKYSYVTMQNIPYTVFSDGRVKKDKYIMWLGGVATGYASGAGTEASPYIIETPEQLAYLSQQVNAGTLYSGVYFRLDNNLDLTASKDKVGNWSGSAWTPIGRTDFNEITTYMFDGVFDGNGKVISGIYINNKASYILGQGLFGANQGTLKNIGVEDSYISGYKSIAGVVGYSKGIVENCYNTGEIRSDFYTGSPNLGGVVGKNIGTVRGCYNTGSITSTKNIDNGGVGGVVGANTKLVENCYNTGTVVGLNGTGGVIGYSQSEISSVPSIIGCYNTGNVTGLTAVGGIVGVCSTTTIENSYNTGRIISNRQSVGGIVGYPANVNVTIENCYNTGYIKVNFTSDEGYEGFMAGGIAGRNYATIINCYNTADIEADRMAAGGITGRNYGSIKNCRNTGNIKSGLNAAGGITGYNDGPIEDTYNSGNVTAIAQYAGGIVGYDFIIGATVKYSYNKGIVTGATSVGGIIGKIKVEGTVIQKCYYLSGVTTRGIGTNVSVDGVDAVGVVESTNENILSYENFLTWIATKK